MKFRITQDQFKNNRWFIQKRGLFDKDWKYFKGDYLSKEEAEKRFSLGPKKRAYIGKVSNCVYCGKPVTDGVEYLPGVCGTGYVSKDGDAVSAYFCNQLCMRNMFREYSGWNGSPWIDSYGLIPFKEPFIV